jgi:hypothetical protein
MTSSVSSTLTSSALSGARWREASVPLTADAQKPEIGSAVFLPIRVILEANLHTWERRRAALQ